MRPWAFAGWFFFAGFLFSAETFRLPTSPELSLSELPSTSRVVLIERPSVVREFRVNGEQVRQMFQSALLQWTGQPDARSAWQKLGVQPSDTVGIKLSTAGGPLLASHRPLVEAILEGLESAGVSRGKMILWDKFEDEMKESGYLPVDGFGKRLSVVAVIPGGGFDPGVFYVNEILGRLIWGDLLFKPHRAALETGTEEKPEKDKDADQFSNKSHFAKVVTKSCTKIINVPVLVDHHSYGLSGCLASLAVGSVDNTRRFQGDGVNGDPAIPEILDRDLFRKKVVLHVMDAMVSQFAGGPKFDPHFSHPTGALYLSTDPVAIDALAVQRIRRWRQEAKVVPLEEMDRHIKASSRYKLGECDPKRIKVISIP